MADPMALESLTTSAPCRRAISPMRSAKNPFESSGEFPAGLGEIGDGRFHSGAAGAGHRQAELVPGGIGVPSKRANLLGHFKERTGPEWPTTFCPMAA